MSAFTAGQRLTADLLNEEFNRVRRVYQEFDQSVLNSTTLVSSTDLVLSVEASTVYTLESYIITDANTTADVKYNILVPSGASVLGHSRWGGKSGDTSVTSSVDRQAGDGFPTLDLSGVGAGTLLTSRPHANIAVSTTAGNVTFQFAQQVANNTNATILKAGSWMELVKITA